MVDSEGDVMNETNIDRMRRGYEAFGKGDLDTLRGLFSPDIVWHAGGDNAISGDYKGIDDVFAMFLKLFEMTEGTMKQDVHDLLASDAHGVAITHVTASRPDGRTMSMNQVAVFHMDDQNRVSEAWIVPTDQTAADAFLS